MFHFTVIFANPVPTVCLGCHICHFFILVVSQISLIKCRVVTELVLIVIDVSLVTMPPKTTSNL